MSPYDPFEEKNENEPEEVSESWDCYVFNTEDGLVLNMVNLAARPDEPNPLTPRYLVPVALASPDAHGFSTPEEDAVLWQVEDALEQLMQQEHGGRYVGRSTHNGMRVFCYYMPPDRCPDGNEIAAALESFEAYTPERNVIDEPDWEYFFEFLYPSPEEMRCMQNHKLIHTLAEHGDLHDVPRPIEHWVYFKSEAGRESFKPAVTELGFTIESESVTEDGALSLRIIREDTIDMARIDELVLTLCKLAEENDGDYDGWETPLVKEEESE